MNKLILNPELFQGEKYLNTNKNYFEGWYFKNTNKINSIAFIPGINITENGKKAFIQVITDEMSYFINYDIKDFKYNISPFSIQIAKNFFSKEKVYIDINDCTQNIAIHGELIYSDNKNIKTNILSPNIMGPFSYIPFMECNHAILSMQNSIKGMININDKKMNFEKGTRLYRKRLGNFFSKIIYLVPRQQF